MKLSFAAVSCALALTGVSFCSAATDLKQSKFTQIVNDVKVLEMPAKKQKPATKDDLFKSPDILRTGPASRAELVAEDRTITRIGANSIFSFDPANRTLNLEQGSVLFHAPKGKGGGTVRTTSAAASVLGTTIIVSATPDGGFKVLTLEGVAKVKLPNGDSVRLRAGQEVFVLPNNKGFSPVITFNLGEQTKGSQLVNGFDNPLPSWDEIQLNIDKQNKLIFAGELSETGLLVGSTATDEGVQVVDEVPLQPQFTAVSHPLEPTHEEPPPPPIIFDIIIRGLIADDSHVVHEYPDHFITGNNVLVDTTLADMSNFGHAPNLRIKANSLMQFNDNASHETEFRTVEPQFEGKTGGIVENLYLSAGTFSFPDIFTVTFNGDGFFIDGLGSLTLSSGTSDQSILTFQNLSSFGQIGVGSPADLTINRHVNFIANRLSFHAGNDLIMHDTTFTTAFSQQSDNAAAGFSTFINMQAENVLSAFNVKFAGSWQSIQMAAKTVVLENINFPSGSFVYLRSESGTLAANPNTGAAVVPLKVNFIRNVNYGGSPAQNEVGKNIQISPLNPVLTAH